MNSWCTQLSGSSDTKILQTGDNALTRDIVLVGDILAGTVFGYCAVYLYYCMVGRSFVITPLGMMIWRELILVSVIGALVVARFDPQPQDDPWCDIRITILGVISRAACAGTLLLGVGWVTGSLRDLARLWLLVWGGSLSVGCASLASRYSPSDATPPRLADDGKPSQLSALANVFLIWLRNFPEERASSISLTMQKSTGADLPRR